MFAIAFAPTMVVETNALLVGPDLSARLLPPSSEHVMGTDGLGRDVLARTVTGLSMSLRLAVAAWLASLVIGIMVGALAGWLAGSLVDSAIRVAISVVYTTPFIILLVGLLAIIGPGLVKAYAVLVLFAWVAPARQTRSLTIAARRSLHLKAVASFGFSPVQTLQSYVIPQVAGPAVLASLAILPEIIALDAALAFFGLGAPPPAPSLGRLIAEGVQYGATAWWIGIFPVVCLITSCLLIRYLSSFWFPEGSRKQFRPGNA